MRSVERRRTPPSDGPSPHVAAHDWGVDPSASVPNAQYVPIACARVRAIETGSRSGGLRRTFGGEQRVGPGGQSLPPALPTVGSDPLLAVAACSRAARPPRRPRVAITERTRLSKGERRPLVRSPLPSPGAEHWTQRKAHSPLASRPTTRVGARVLAHDPPR